MPSEPRLRAQLRSFRLGVVATWLLCVGCVGEVSPLELADEQQAALSTFSDVRAWSQQPPGLHPLDVPQFVAVTFDDNFVSGIGDPSGGMTWATGLFQSLVNPAGTAHAPTFDGKPARTTFYNNCVYLEDDNTKKSWKTAFEAGHEIANHTVHHPSGAAFTAQEWTDEIAPCTAALSNAASGVGVSVDDVRGFRSPYLGYGSALFGVLKTQGLWYDSSVQSCWGAGQDGKNCAWPYTLDQGSPDAADLTAKFTTPTVPATTGLWELTPSALFVPPDELATQYGFTAGLRQRIPTDMPAPNFYEAATGRIAPLDVTLFVDAKLNPAEVLAILKYTLDLRLAGNRAPFVFIAHSHVYASNYGVAPNAPSADERQGAIEAFVQYALSKPVVRMRPVSDIMNWMRTPQPLDGKVTTPAGGNGGMGGGAGAAGSGGGSGSGGNLGSGGAAGMGPGVGGAPSLAGSSSVAGSPSAEASDASCGCRTSASAPDPTSFALGLAPLALLLRRRRPR